MSYIKSDKLSKLVEGKSVALVGPAGYLTGKGTGDIIDKYDVVCRVNYMSTNSIATDFGSKTDILFYNCCTASLGKMKKHFEGQAELAKKIQLVVCPAIKVLGPEKWKEWDLDFISPVVNNFTSINVHNLDFHWVGIRNYIYMFDKIKCQEPNSGMLAAVSILEHNPKDLFVTGFTFYANAKDTHFDNYPMLPDRWNGVCGHPQSLQIDFFKKYMTQKNIKIDSHLNKLLKTNHSNLLDLETGR